MSRPTDESFLAAFFALYARQEGYNTNLQGLAETRPREDRAPDFQQATVATSPVVLL